MLNNPTTLKPGTIISDYNDRLLECRALKCWDTRELEQIYATTRLRRKDFVSGVKRLVGSDGRSAIGLCGSRTRAIIDKRRSSGFCRLRITRRVFGRKGEKLLNGIRAFLLGLICLMISCQEKGIDQVSEFPEQERSLSETITLASWNAQKFHNCQSVDDLQALIEKQKPDVVFVQESRADLVRMRHIGGYFAEAWSYPWPGGITTGVLTLSRVAPDRVEPVPSKHGEFFMIAPKVFLITEYSLPDREILLAVNVHLVSFERWRLLAFRSQLDDLKAIIENHRGPVIMAGDFNTWSQKRLGLVQALAEQLGLKEVTDFPSGRTTADMRLAGLNRLLGIKKDFPLDRIYQRGFTSHSAQVLPYDSSDHKPILVTLTRPTI